MIDKLKPNGFSEKSISIGCITLLISSYIYVFSRGYALLLSLITLSSIGIGFIVLLFRVLTVSKPSWRNVRRLGAITLIIFLVYQASYITNLSGLWTYFLINQNKLNHAFENREQAESGWVEIHGWRVHSGENVLSVEIGGFLDVRHGFLKSINYLDLSQAELDGYEKRKIHIRQLKDGWYYYHS